MVSFFVSDILLCQKDVDFLGYKPDPTVLGKRPGSSVKWLQCSFSISCPDLTASVLKVRTRGDLKLLRQELLYSLLLTNHF